MIIIRLDHKKRERNKLMTDNNLYILNKAWNTLQKLEGIITALEYVGINIDGSNNNSHAGLNDIYNAITDQYDIILNIFNAISGMKTPAVEIVGIFV